MIPHLSHLVSPFLTFLPPRNLFIQTLSLSPFLPLTCSLMHGHHVAEFNSDPAQPVHVTQALSVVMGLVYAMLVNSTDSQCHGSEPNAGTCRFFAISPFVNERRPFVKQTESTHLKREMDLYHGSCLVVIELLCVVAPPQRQSSCTFLKKS